MGNHFIIKYYLVLFFVLLQLACSRNKPQPGSLPFNPPKVVEAVSFKIPGEMTEAPHVITASGMKKIFVRNPKIVQHGSNQFPAIPERIIPVAVIEKFNSATGDANLSRVLPAINNFVKAGAPEIVAIKDFSIKENNPESFSTIKEMHGLNSTQISSLCQDDRSNLWIGTWGGGISKYDGQSLTNYTTGQGLSSDNVNCIFADKDDNIWVGTVDAGINRLDGKFITHYSTAEGLSSNGVMHITQDRNGSIWIATIDGLNRFDEDSFTHYTTEQGLPTNFVRDILEDTKGNLWVSTNGGLSKFNGHSFQIYTSGLGLSHTTEVETIFEDNQGTLWVGSSAGLFKYEGQNISHFTEKSGLSQNRISKIIEDNNGHLLIATWDHGVNKYDGKSFTHLGIEQGLSSEIVSAMLRDQRGVIWVGTAQGVSKYDGELFKHIVPEKRLSNENISCIATDKKGNIWVGTWGNGATRFDEKHSKHFTTAEGLINDYITFILEDTSGNIWFGTREGVAKYDGISFRHYSTLNGLIDQQVYCMLEDKAGILWFGTGKGLSSFNGESFTNYSTKQGLIGETIFSILEDHKGVLWFGTSDKGICTFDRVSFTHYDMASSLSNATVIGMTEDRHGNIWFCTSKGVNKFDGKFFTWYTVEQGLSNNIVKNVLEDKYGNLWVGTLNGMNRFIPGEAAAGNGHSFFKKYSVSEGFLGTGTFENSITMDKRGNVWIGSPSRVSVYHHRGDIPDTIPPTIQLRGVALFDENVNWYDLDQKKDTTLILGNGTKFKDFNFNHLTPWYSQPENLQLSHNNNYITFHFVGITTNRPKEVRYQFMLEGLDENWSTITEVPEAKYNSLRPGKFTFKVKAVNSEGYWSDELSYPFVIRPPWWKTWWFRSMAVVCLLTIFYAMIRWRLQQKFRLQLERSEKETKLAEMGMKTAELQQQATELEMQALRAQMNPHFIFNSLNSINAFILENNKLKASEYLSKFSRLVRLILQNSQQAFIPLDKELEALQLYLELESLRFEQKFEYKISVNDEVDTTIVNVPPLIIQPYAENAIWHGLMHLPDRSQGTPLEQAGKKEKGHLEIELYIEDKILFCKITDNGVGRKRAKELKSKSSLTYKSMGMRITADRIAKLQQQEDTNAFVSVTDLVFPDNSPAGTEVLIKIPVHYD